jgi:hypothetical protein
VGRGVPGEREAACTTETSATIHTMQEQQKNQHQHCITVKSKAKLIFIAESYVSDYCHAIVNA